MKKKLGIAVMLLVFLGMVAGFVAFVSGETEESTVLGLLWLVFLAAFAYSLPDSGAKASATMSWAERNWRKKWGKAIMLAGVVVGVPALVLGLLFSHQAEDIQKRIERYPQIENVPTYLLRNHNEANYRSNVVWGVFTLSVCVSAFGVVIYRVGTDSAANEALLNSEPLRRATHHTTIAAAAAAAPRTQQGQGKRVLWFMLKTAVSLYLMAGGGELMHDAAKYAVLMDNNSILFLACFVYTGFVYWGYRVIWVPIARA